MKKGKKIIIAVCAIVVILLVIGFFQKEESKTFQIEASKIDKIVVDENENNVKIEESSDDKIYVKYIQGNGVDYTIKEENGKLNISDSVIKITIGLFTKENELVIQIPKDYGKDIKVETKSSCSCSCDENIIFDKKDIDCDF